jgi:glycosyltransferase involved in cell wall biosynthesis
MRIAFLSEHYPPTDGGVATSTQRVARNLQQLGANVHVFCFDNSRPLTSEDYTAEEIDQGVRVTRVGPFFLKQKGVPVDSISEKVRATLRRRAFAQIARILEAEGGADILLSFYLINAGFLGTYVARAIGVPHIAGVRGNDIGRNIFHTERFAVTQWIVRGADRIVCVNQFLRGKLLLAFPEVAENALVIPNSVTLPPDDAFDRMEARQRVLAHTGWDASSVLAAFIGTLREKKGVHALLLAMDRLPQGSPLRLLVVGPPLGSLERHICGDLWDRLIAEGRAWHTGRISLGEVAGWVAGSDVVTMPSLDDGMANGLLEGMALGLCPVATEVFSDVVTDGENGVVVPSANPQALAAALHRLSADPAMTARLGKAARASLARYTPADEAGAYLSLFEQCLQPVSTGERGYA